MPKLHGVYLPKTEAQKTAEEGEAPAVPGVIPGLEKASPTGLPMVGHVRRASDSISKTRTVQTPQMRQALARQVASEGAVPGASAMPHLARLGLTSGAGLGMGLMAGKRLLSGGGRRGDDEEDDGFMSDMARGAVLGGGLGWLGKKMYVNPILKERLQQHVDAGGKIPEGLVRRGIGAAGGAIASGAKGAVDVAKEVVEGPRGSRRRPAGSRGQPDAKGTSTAGARTPDPSSSGAAVEQTLTDQTLHTPGGVDSGKPLPGLAMPNSPAGTSQGSPRRVHLGQLPSEFTPPVRGKRKGTTKKPTPAEKQVVFSPGHPAGKTVKANSLNGLYIPHFSPADVDAEVAALKTASHQPFHFRGLYMPKTAQMGSPTTGQPQVGKSPSVVSPPQVAGMTALSSGLPDAQAPGPSPVAVN